MTTQQFCEQLYKILPKEQILREEPLRKHTTFRIGGPAELFVTPDVKQLGEILRLTAETGYPVTLIGNGSNLLVSDAGIRGLVVEFGQAMEYVDIEGERIRIGAGTLLSKAANAAASAGLSGMEFAAGIPGSLGGAIVMNAGAYGGEMKDIVSEAVVLTGRGERRVLSLDELDLSYRHSCIPKKHYVVVEATLQLERKDTESIRSVMGELREKRVSKQPLEFPSAGSTFKRPEGYFAGKLIMDAGLAGYSVGDAQVSAKHCGFVINRGAATAEQVRQLIYDVQRKVYEAFQVRLEPEVKMVGDFETALFMERQ